LKLLNVFLDVKECFKDFLKLHKKVLSLLSTIRK